MERSVVYYRNKDNKPGRKATTVTIYKNEIVNEEYVLKGVKSLLDHEFLSYGYLKISKQLQMDGYVINKKKVYRIMKSYNLLKPQRIKTSGKRNFVKFRKPQTEKPLTYFEMDIKYIYIPQERRNAYLLSVIDVHSRKVIGHVFKRSIRKVDVINLWQSLKPLLGDFKEITIRSDNGSQFIANDVRGYFYYHGVKHEFTNIATPEDDGHIEAFHSILEREFLRRNDYTSLDEMKTAISRFMKCYNEERLHGSLNYRTPEQFIKDFNENELKLNQNNIENLTELCQTVYDF
ncbi:MAG: IS3 family transposase [Candidatus Kuenenia stuttgartiensis]|nr:IS3 family transposase [Candidatus Kuenenia stuttgartiensis]